MTDAAQQALPPDFVAAEIAESLRPHEVYHGARLYLRCGCCHNAWTEDGRPAESHAALCAYAIAKGALAMWGPAIRPTIGMHAGRAALEGQR